MRYTWFLALAALAAAQSTTIELGNGVVVVLPTWNTAAGPNGADSPGVESPSPTTPTSESADVSTDLPETTTTAAADTTEAAGTGTATGSPTTTIATVSGESPSETGTTPPAVTVNGAGSIGAKSWAGLVAFAAASLVLL